MLFSEALKALHEGKYLKRTEWTDGYLVLMPAIAYIWRIITPSPTSPNANAGNWLPMVADLEADDWELVTQ